MKTTIIMATFALATWCIWWALNSHWREFIFSVKHRWVWRVRLERYWAGALLFLAGALKAGLSLEQALETLVQESPEPFRSELLNRWGGDVQWLSMENRIERLLDAPSLALARAALLFSHRSGGRVVRLLEVSADVLRKKLEMQDKVGALTAQAKASAWIVGLMPIVLLFCFYFFSPEFVQPLFSTRLGWSILGLIVVLVSAGLFFVQRFARVDT